MGTYNATTGIENAKPGHLKIKSQKHQTAENITPLPTSKSSPPPPLKIYPAFAYTILKRATIQQNGYNISRIWIN
jgi:hypothetical protein